MHMATRTRKPFRWTRGDLARLPDDGNRYEVLDGELLVTPQASYRHQDIAARLFRALGEYCARHSIATVVGPGAIPFGRSELQPDVQVIPGQPPARKGVKWSDLPRPMLVAEVLSDSTAHRDLGKKREAYLRIGVAEYWAVDPDAREVHVFRSGTEEPAIVRHVLRWQPIEDVPPLEIPIGVIVPDWPA
jgi:Uma2 family endonuclease